MTFLPFDHPLLIYHFETGIRPLINKLKVFLKEFRLIWMLPFPLNDNLLNNCLFAEFLLDLYTCLLQLWKKNLNSINISIKNIRILLESPIKTTLLFCRIFFASSLKKISASISPDVIFYLKKQLWILNFLVFKTYYSEIRIIIYLEFIKFNF